MTTTFMPLSKEKDDTLPKASKGRLKSTTMAKQKLRIVIINYFAFTGGLARILTPNLFKRANSSSLSSVIEEYALK